MRVSFFMLVVLLGTLMLPLVSHPAAAADSDEVLVCCDASEVDLYLIGSDSNKKLTPFAKELGDDSQSTVVENSFTSQELIGRWVLADTWAGDVPASTWTFSMEYTVSNAAGAQVNATATVLVGSKSFSAQTDASSSFLAQGSGTMVFDIEVESFSISGSNKVELELEAQGVVFSVPAGDAKLEFLWGSEEDDSSLQATLPLLDIMILEPEVEGSEVYVSVTLDSPWGMSTLALSDSIGLKVNGQDVGGDPIETASGDTVRVTWTWTDAQGGVETIEVGVELKFQASKPALTGSTSFEIETFDSTGGTGTYYPPDEPLRTNGDGSSLDVRIEMELSPTNGKLELKKSTIITVDNEMAFWMRWGLDHIGDETPALSAPIRAFAAGGVSDDDRVSRSIEEVEIDEFQRQMIDLAPLYLSSGMGLDSGELLGNFRDFTTSPEIELDLNGNSDVVNHPVTLKFTTIEQVSNGERIDLLRNFIVVQPVELWSEYSLDLKATSTSFSAFSYSALQETEELDMTIMRFPWGDQIVLRGEGIDQGESFSLATVPTTSVIDSPMPLSVISVIACLAAFVIAMRLTRERKRTYFYMEMIFLPVVALIQLFGYPAPFVGVVIIGMSVIWWVTALASPRTQPRGGSARSQHPTIPCPACQVMNPVVTNERPHRFACEGCQRIIKLVA